jgi:hypothetical protein
MRQKNIRMTPQPLNGPAPGMASLSSAGSSSSQVSLANSQFMPLWEFDTSRDRVPTSGTGKLNRQIDRIGG